MKIIYEPWFKDQEEIVSKYDEIKKVFDQNKQSNSIKTKIEGIIGNSMEAAMCLKVAARKGDQDNTRKLFKLYHEEIEKLEYADIFIPYCVMLMEGVDDSHAFHPEKLKTIYSHATADEPVLLIGETGTSKGLIAKSIYRMSKLKTFVSINCSAFPEHLMESELFGHKKGAFTGATSDTKGLFEVAQGGMLYLDELGKMPSHLQAKVLKAVEEHEYYPVGARVAVKLTNIRIIASVQPKEMDDEEKLLPDLMYRLGYPDSIRLPNLNERLPEAYEVILNGIGHAIQREMNITMDMDFDNSNFKDLLINYRYSGNFRELRNILRSAFRLAKIDKRERVELSDFKIMHTLANSNLVNPQSSETSSAKNKYLDDIPLKEILDYSKNIAIEQRKSIINNKVIEVMRTGKRVKQVLEEEGRNKTEYQNFLKDVHRITGLHVGDYKKLL